MHATKVGLPNSCTKCGKKLTRKWWVEDDEQAMAGQGYCERCAGPDLEAVTMLGQRLAVLLLRHGYRTLEQIAEATDEELSAIDGVGQATLRKIRNVVHV